MLHFLTNWRRRSRSAAGSVGFKQNLYVLYQVDIYFFNNLIEKHVMTHNKERQVLTCKYNCGFSTKQGTQLSYHYRMQHLMNTSGDAVKSKENA